MSMPADGVDTTGDAPWTFLLQYIEKGLELIVKLVRSAIAETSQYVPYQELPVAGPADTDVRWAGAAALIALAIALASLWFVLWRTRPRTRPGAAPPLVTGGVSWRRVE